MFREVCSLVCCWWGVVTMTAFSLTLTLQYGHAFVCHYLFYTNVTSVIREGFLYFCSS